MSTSSATRGDGWLRLEWLRHGRNSGCSAIPRGLITILSGNATTEAAHAAVIAFREAIASHMPIEVDLSQTSAMDARFLGLLLMLRKTLKDSGLTLNFVGISRALARQFRRNGLEYLLSPGQQHYDDTIH